MYSPVCVGLGRNPEDSFHHDAAQIIQSYQAVYTKIIVFAILSALYALLYGLILSVSFFGLLIQAGKSTEPDQDLKPSQTV